MRKLLAAVLIFCPVLFAQVEHAKGGSPYSFTPEFNIDLAGYKGSVNNKTRVDVFLQVPYSSVQFIKASEGYIARYSVSLTFYDEDRSTIIFERIWNEKIIATNFAQTSSKQSFNLSYRSFEILSGNYNLKIVVEDLDSRKTSSMDRMVIIASYKDPLDISDLILIKDRITEDGQERIIPNVSREVTNKDKSISFFYEIYSDMQRQVTISYKIEDKDRNVIYSLDEEKTVAPGINTVEHTIEEPKLSLGDYNLIVRVESRDINSIKLAQKTIFSKIYGVPASIKDLDKAIDQMIYIASTDEIDEIETGKTYEDKLKNFLYFWNLKDPSPNTEENEVLSEYYRRINYANEKFQSFYEGWRTDMGMIFVTLGAPDYVERYPFSESSKPYEIWDYYDINKRFIFVDQTGFGDYRLLNPVFGDWYRYRQ